MRQETWRIKNLQIFAAIGSVDCLFNLRFGVRSGVTMTLRVVAVLMLILSATGAFAAQSGAAQNNPPAGGANNGNNDGGNANGGNNASGGGAVVATSNTSPGQRPIFGNAGGGSVQARTPAQNNCSAQITKAALPEAVELKALDTSKFDRVADSLKLTSEQFAGVEKAKAQIRTESEKLSTAQIQARDEYKQAATEPAYREASRKFHDAADACRDFRPEIKFECALDKILSPEQARAYRKP
jgi:hypothetical protein